MERDDSSGRNHLVKCANRTMMKVVDSARRVCLKDSEGRVNSPYGIDNAIMMATCARIKYAGFFQLKLMTMAGT
jgi:hypothetical protein